MKVSEGSWNIADVEIGDIDAKEDGNNVPNVIDGPCILIISAVCYEFSPIPEGQSIVK